MGQYLIPEGANLRVVPLLGHVVAGRIAGHVSGQLTALVQPLLATAVHHLGVGVAEKLEDPEGVTGPPIGLVAVEDDGGVVLDAQAPHEGLELLLADVVPDDGIVQILLPVDLQRAGNVACVVEQHILVGFEDAHVGIVQMFGHPIGADQNLGMGISCIVHGVLLIEIYGVHTSTAYIPELDGRLVTSSRRIGPIPESRTTLSRQSCARSPVPVCAERTPQAHGPRPPGKSPVRSYALPGLVSNPGP